MWTTTLAWLLLAFVLLETVLSGRNPPARKKALREEKKMLKKSRKAMEKDTKKWGKSWEATKKNKTQTLTKEQKRYWRKLSEYPKEEDEDPVKRSMLDDNDRDMPRLSRHKRTGPLIPEPRRVRREWRQMTLDQKQNFIRAFNGIANFIPDRIQAPNTSIFDIFVRWHRFSSAPGAHQGPSFLPWHREFLWRLSNALRLQGYRRRQDLPYLDTALDQFLPNPRDAAIWIADPEGIGINDGTLGAPFSQSLVTQILECNGGAPVTRLARVAAAAKNQLYTRTKYAIVMGKSCYDHLCRNTDRDMESFHNTGHMFVGGTMGSASCSPRDPAFWLHHANVDCLWEEYRQTQQDPYIRTVEYPQLDLGERPRVMAWNSSMSPFDDWGMKNIHGLSNHYTNYYYRCAQRPSAIRCRNHSDCVPSSITNPMLWCEVATQFCVAKIREGGQCDTSWPPEQCFCINPNRTAICTAGSRCICN